MNPSRTGPAGSHSALIAVENCAGRFAGFFVGLQIERLHVEVLPRGLEDASIRPRIARPDLVGAAVRAVAGRPPEQHLVADGVVLLAIRGIQRKPAVGIAPANAAEQQLAVPVIDVVRATIVHAARARLHVGKAAVECRRRSQPVRRAQSRLDEELAPPRILLVPGRRERRGRTKEVFCHAEQRDCAIEQSRDEQVATAIKARPRLHVAGLQNALHGIVVRDGLALLGIRKAVQDRARGMVLLGIGDGAVVSIVALRGTGHGLELRVSDRWRLREHNRDQRDSRRPRNPPQHHISSSVRPRVSLMYRMTKKIAAAAKNAYTA